ncbi:MAG: hypothetical protein V4603_11925, partial [Pseudomonadota bacterium]
PDISELADYRPKLPLRVFSSEGIQIGEFGEERRNLTPIDTIPKVMKDAVLAIEKLAPALGAPWAKAFAEKTTHSAQMLFAGGDIEGAEQAFRLAAKLGGPRYVNNAGAYALLARILGPLNAERVAAMYRRVPLALRLVFHRRSE